MSRSSSETLPTGNTDALFARTLPGLHEVLFKKLDHFVPRGSPVLDLGAGTGAWAQRIRSSGYPVTCVDLDGEGFALRDVEFHSANLNDDFAPLFSKKFRAITAIEVIEHLHNPRHFLRQCANLLTDDGHVLLTTPNIECIPARLRFLLDGHFRMFGRDPAMNDATHITPIQTFMFERMLADTGYRLVAHTFNRPTSTTSRPVSRLIAACLEPFLRGTKGGDCHIFVLARG